MVLREFTTLAACSRSPQLLLLHIQRCKHHRFVMHLGGVLIDGRGRLSAPIAITRIELESTDTVRAVGAGELHASLDAGDGVEAFHTLECSRGA